MQGYVTEDIWIYRDIWGYTDMQGYATVDIWTYRDI